MLSGIQIEIFCRSALFLYHHLIGWVRLTSKVACDSNPVHYERSHRFGHLELTLIRSSGSAKLPSLDSVKFLWPMRTVLLFIRGRVILCGLNAKLMVFLHHLSSGTKWVEVDLHFKSYSLLSPRFLGINSGRVRATSSIHYKLLWYDLWQFNENGFLVLIFQPITI